MKTLYDALERYAKSLSDADYAQLKTALIRYVIPGWGGPKLSGARTTAKELEAGIQYMKAAPAGRLRDALKIQESVFKEVGAPGSSRRNYRYQLGRFIEWAKGNGLVVEDDQATTLSKTTSEIQFRNREFPRETAFEYRKRMGVNRVAGKTIVLRSVGDELSQQIESYREFRLTHVRECTFNSDLRLLKRYLGWICEGKKISDSLITINHAIPFVKLRYSEDNFSDSKNAFMQATIAEKQAMKEAERLAQEVVCSVEEYRATASKMSYQSSTRIVIALINLSKWIYKDETQANFIDIPICARLGELKRCYVKASKNEPCAVPYALKSADWSELPDVIEHLKKEADADKSSGGRCRDKRSIGISIQRLLVFSLFVAIPPRRSRVIAELELGRTLQKGKVDSRSGFTPESLLKPEEGIKWCITLSPKDYKTGKTYGSQSFEINNMPYGDGTFLYDYIDKWMNEYRPLFQPDHNRIFVSHRSHKYQVVGGPISVTTVKGIVSGATLKSIGRPISPKEFRKMFVSYISNRSDMSEADLEAAARAMAHSRQMQMKVYDQVTSEARLATGMGLAERLWKEVSQAKNS
jgi:hypothetical protein